MWALPGFVIGVVISEAYAMVRWSDSAQLARRRCIIIGGIILAVVLLAVAR